MTSRPPPAEPLDLDRITEVVEHVRMTPLMLIGESFRILFVTDIPGAHGPRSRAGNRERGAPRVGRAGIGGLRRNKELACLYCGLVE
jgi:hypothetical protein